jgi:hypothetical protein
LGRPGALAGSQEFNKTTSNWASKTGSPVKPIINTTPSKPLPPAGVDRLLLMHTVSGIC